jgi:hypothetical protein
MENLDNCQLKFLQYISLAIKALQTDRVISENINNDTILNLLKKTADKSNTSGTFTKVGEAEYPCLTCNELISEGKKEKAAKALQCVLYCGTHMKKQIMNTSNHLKCREIRSKFLILNDMNVLKGLTSNCRLIGRTTIALVPDETLDDDEYFVLVYMGCTLGVLGICNYNQKKNDIKFYSYHKSESQVITFAKNYRMVCSSIKGKNGKLTKGEENLLNDFKMKSEEYREDINRINNNK